MIGHILAAAALLTAQAPQRPCITKDQAGDFAVIALPEIVNIVAQQCSAHLPANAFLRSGVTAYVQQLRTEAAARQANVASAFSALTAGSPMQGLTPQAAAAAMSSSPMIQQGMAGRFNAQTCPEINRFMEAISPLPAASWATMISSGLGDAMAMEAQPAAPAGGSSGGTAAAPPAPRQFGPLCAQ